MQQIPLPPTEASPKFQSWHHFDPVQHWVSVAPTRLYNTSVNSTSAGSPSDLVLLTWNIDATSSRAQDRVAEIITFVTNLDPKVDVIFFLEVSKPALQQFLGDSRIRSSWISSECDDTAWGKQSFATITLMPKARFANTDPGAVPPLHSLGPIWRLKYPSCFDRYALCCDIFIPSASDPELASKASSTTRLRLINVHLDSLPIQPFYRPQQISIISSYLHATGCGVVAGDLNLVLEEDNSLVDKNNLADAWVALRSEDPGYT
ncbi:unnamed protein product [Penicillium salamii]|uniref:Endonuclease/exonuclease/phosphatase domain-containing protein n=1 Tax=Penicillium salamii TaxID=1612424 RepID=A0A9W4JJ55_9EURO|nr:unnamed protein product [Penicillium salamii]